MIYATKEPGLGTRDNRHERPYRIDYVHGDRVLRDSARSLEDAKARIETRLAKRHNRGERARVVLRGVTVFETEKMKAGQCQTQSIDL